MRILVVEDEDPKLRHIMEFLQSAVANLEVATARSVRSAIDALEDAPPDLLILDMSLPTFDIGGDEGGGRPQGFGGQELMRTMMLEENHTPVIVLTGYDAFNKAGGQIGLEVLNSELRAEHPRNFLGMLHFNSAVGGWQAKLRELLEEFGVQLK
jgi:CheY-like chemotaxis protein